MMVPKRRVVPMLQKYGTLVGFAVAFIGLYLHTPEFLSPGNLVAILKQASLVMPVSLAMTFVLISGSVNLSIGSVNSLTANICAGIISAGHGVVSAITGATAVGLCCGLANGVMIAYGGLSPFVCGLGMKFVVTGVELIYNKGLRMVISEQSPFILISRGQVGPIPSLILIMFLLVAICYLVMHKTRLGFAIYATGANPQAANTSGANTRASLISAFAISGAMCGLGGILLSSSLGGSNPTQLGFSYLIDAFACSLLGTTMLREGELHVIGTMLSVICMSALVNGLVMTGMPFTVIDGCKGIILLLAVAIGGIRVRHQNIVAQTKLYG